MDIDILMREFCDYARYILGHSPATIERYKKAIMLYSKVTGLKNITDINEQNLKMFLMNGRTSRNWKPRTFILYRMTLRVFFKWCIKQGLMKTNFTDDIEIPRVGKRIPKSFTKQEALKLLELVYNYPYEHKFLRDRNHAIFATFIFAGLRRNELLNLKYSDIDFDNLTMFVRGKGDKDRVIPIHYTLAQSLKRYLEERKRLKKTCPEFFTSLTRNSGFTKDGLKHLVVNLRKALNLKFSAHPLRHTFATLMFEGNCNIYSLSKLMGHSDIRTTTIYLSASVEHLRNEIFKHPLNNETCK